MTFTYTATPVSVVMNRVLYAYKPDIIHHDVIGNTADGDIKTYDFDTTEYFCAFTVEMDESTFAALLSFYNTSTAGRTKAFTITPDAIMNLGIGAGVAVATAHFWEKPQGQLIANNLYKVEISVTHKGA